MTSEIVIYIYFEYYHVSILHRRIYIIMVVDLMNDK